MWKTSDGKNMRSKGFTLIELLIVVAIIAILAAIAVPNFLEAQVRAKVSRVHADMRTIATGLEAYMVDWGAYMLSGIESFPIFYGAWPDPPSQEWVNIVQEMYNEKQGRPTMRQWEFSQLTTPVAYLTTIYTDPFVEKVGAYFNASRVRAYHYERISGQMGHEFRYKAYQQYGFAWVTVSVGPWRKSTIGSVPQALMGAWKGNQPKNFQGPYDPSNGTISMGMVYRTNKGIYSTNPDEEKNANKGGF